MTDLAELARRVDELTSREQIRDAIFGYASCIDRLDAEGMKRSYHADAQDIHWNSFIGNAHDFADHIVRELRSAKHIIHEVTNPLIKLQGERAFVESRYTTRMRLEFDGAEDGQWIESIAHGRYLDIFERRENIWKIAHRRLAQDGGRISVVTDIGHYRPEAQGMRAPDDMVYKTFDIVDFAPSPTEPRGGRFEALRQLGGKLRRT